MNAKQVLDLAQKSCLEGNGKTCPNLGCYSFCESCFTKAIDAALAEAQQEERDRCIQWVLDASNKYEETGRYEYVEVLIHIRNGHTP